jgi:4-alpha-glucanotransferase
MLGGAVSCVTRDESAPGEPLLPPAKWPSQVAASISTHDLPTAAGFLRAEHVRVRAELGLLDDAAAAQAAAAKERAEWLALLGSEGLLGPDNNANSRTPATPEALIIEAMHRFLAATPSRLKLLSPYDVLAEPRQPNLPGTVDQYPNWRLPLPESLEQLRTDPRAARIAALFSDGTGASRPTEVGDPADGR